VGWGIRGLIEGFYGRPWTWDERLLVLRHCAERGMTDYVYAPKSEPKHRDRWREPYDGAELDGFARLVAGAGVRVGFAVSPGLTVDPASADDRRDLGAKVDQVVATGVDLVCLGLDDLPWRPGLGPGHAALADWLAGHLAGRADLVLVPTEYAGTQSTPYLDALAEAVPAGVPVAWTGEAVVNDRVTAAQARARADALGGRPPLLWDNYPVNDALMADRLHLGPLWGRDPGLADACCGYLANPMVQPRASLLPLASVAAWLRGDDPVAAWLAEAGDLRVFAEACDGAVPAALVQSLADAVDGPGWQQAAVPLGRWLSRAVGCPAPGVEEEVGPWLAAVHGEAAVAVSAMLLLQACRPVVTLGRDGIGRVAPPDDDAAARHAFDLLHAWPRLRRSEPQVMGVRRGVQPSLGQRADGRWAFLPGVLVEDRNAVDALVRLAFRALEGMGPPEPPAVTTDEEPVDVAEDGTFAVPPGATALARCGRLATLVRPPAGPPMAAPAP
jgi:beta-N-acetylglucosaminidase